MTNRTPSDEVRRRAFTAMLTDAFLTWPSAVTIALTLIAFFAQIDIGIPGWQPWMWILVGSVLQVIYLIVTMSDPATQQQAMRRMLSVQYDPREIRNFAARQRLQKALEYKRVIDEFVNKQTGPMQISLRDTAESIEEWIALIHRLAKSIDTFESNTIIARDRRSVPTEISSLERRLRAEKDPAVRAELQRAIEIRRSLLDDLERVANLVKRTEIKMDTTVAQLSTVHAKMQLLDARELDSGRARRLQTEIREEIHSLEDVVGAMADVYAYAGYGSAVEKLSEDAGAADETERTAEELASEEEDRSKRLRGGN